MPAAHRRARPRRWRDSTPSLWMIRRGAKVPGLRPMRLRKRKESRHKVKPLLFSSGICTHSLWQTLSAALADRCAAYNPSLSYASRINRTLRARILIGAVRQAFAREEIVVIYIGRRQDRAIRRLDGSYRPSTARLALSIPQPGARIDSRILACWESYPALPAERSSREMHARC